nr:hypothetical protein [Fredinandcohnia onubensis]
MEEAKCEKHMDHMAAGADEDPGTPLNPREVSEEDMKKIYIAANNGDEDNQRIIRAWHRNEYFYFCFVIERR